MLLRKRFKKSRLMSLAFISALLILLITALDLSKVSAATIDEMKNDKFVNRTGLTVEDRFTNRVTVLAEEKRNSLGNFLAVSHPCDSKLQKSSKAYFKINNGDDDPSDILARLVPTAFHNENDLSADVIYVGQSINTHYDSQVASILNNASTKLLMEADADTNAYRLNDAVIKYRILMNTYGVPQNIRDAAIKNESDIMVDFNAAKYFSTKGDYFNAVHYASVAEVFGLSLEEVTTFLNNAASQLSAVADKKANNKQYNEAVSDYQKLIGAFGVPEYIKQTAQSKLNNLTKESTKTRE
ncbi:hypothetical protein [Bacillus cereus]|uniref:hypothetical protein n=1 Tax=Bacillus cereus TaxID=1396 RepID=UPI000B4AC94B|nr:hypothetical protein [Bacillus cereus]